MESPSSETAWRPSLVLCTALSSRPAASTPGLLPLPIGIGFLPGFEHVEEKVSLRVGAINELEGRGLPLRGTPIAVQRLTLASVALEFSSLPNCPAGVTVQDAVTHVLGREPGYVDDMATGKPALFKRGLVSLPRVQAGLVPLSSVVPPNVRPLLEDTMLLPRFCNATAQKALMTGWPLMHGFVVALDCMVGSWETCMPKV